MQEQRSGHPVYNVMAFVTAINRAGECSAAALCLFLKNMELHTANTIPVIPKFLEALNRGHC